MKREHKEQPTPSQEEEQAPLQDEETPVLAAPQEEDGVKDQLLRLRADFDNFRKRTMVEKQQLSRYALEPIACEILDALDDMERALNSPEHSDEEWRRGVEMIYKKILGAMEKHGVKPIAAGGEAFDPNLHEAMTAFPSPDVDCDTVKEEVQKGYMLHDRVIRHAKVVVATADGCEEGNGKDNRTENETNINEMEGDE